MVNEQSPSCSPLETPGSRPNVWIVCQAGGLRGIHASQAGAEKEIADICREHPDLWRSDFIVHCDRIRGLVETPGSRSGLDDLWQLAYAWRIRSGDQMGIGIANQTRVACADELEAALKLLRSGPVLPSAEKDWKKEVRALGDSQHLAAERATASSNKPEAVEDECDACPEVGRCHWCYDTGKSVEYIKRAVTAAPFLLAALKAMVASYDGIRDGLTSPVVIAKLAAADAAIAKAERDQPRSAPPVVDLMDALRRALPSAASRDAQPPAIERIETMSGDELCVICSAPVQREQRDAHLAAAHPAPAGGFEFFHNAVGYRTEHPSMLVSNLLAAVGASATYQVYEDRAGAMIPFSHDQSIDLTNGPRRFYSLPAARG